MCVYVYMNWESEKPESLKNWAEKQGEIYTNLKLRNPNERASGNWRWVLKFKGGIWGWRDLKESKESESKWERN